MRTARSLFLSSLVALLSCAPAPTIDEMVADLSGGMESPLPVVALGAAPSASGGSYLKCPFCHVVLATHESKITSHFVPHYRTAQYKAYKSDVDAYVSAATGTIRGVHRWSECWKNHEAEEARVEQELGEYPGNLAAWKQGASKAAIQMEDFNKQYKGKPETPESRNLYGQLRDKWAFLKSWKKVLDRREALAQERRKLDEERDNLSSQFQDLDNSYGSLSHKVSVLRDAAVETKSVGPYLATNPERFEDDIVGNGHCVPFVRAVTGAPPSSLWKEGKKVRGASLEAGTAIATFVDGRYPNNPTGQHAAIYIGQDNSGIEVWHQYLGKKVHRYKIRFKGGQGSRSNDGDAFSVIE